ncbi:MAG: sigma-54-dependent Fis family transcriptional regulator [Bdellovibrionaceae bacterium]|nr:sigma-54-dependent Fis family transcriptional regulator [Pseudobdellovibrionaceae bacterium]
MTQKRIFVVDDDKNMRKSLQIALKNEGFSVSVFQDPVAVLKELKNIEPDIIVSDICMSELTGIELFQKLISDGFDIPVIFISGQASLSDAVKGVQMGAYDFIEKPFAPEKLIVTIEKCLQLKKIKNEIDDLKSQAVENGFKGKAAAFMNVVDAIGKVAPTTASVLITGESGTGKELIAKEIHIQSRISNGPFIKVNCSSIPENLIESELFGYTKGAFTGADRNKKGFFELAHGGTIFLDEIGEMSLSAQAKVLRATQQKEIQKLGSETVIPVDVRIIAATNRDLFNEVASGRFREDLYFRLNVFPIHAPALRERIQDIPLLAEHFLSEYVRINRTPQKFFSPEAMKKLMDYSWPGNIRELKNVVERLSIIGGQVLDVNLLSFMDGSAIHKSTVNSSSLKDFKNRVEREYILNTLKQTEGNISEAASLLEIERTYLHKKIQDYKIQKREYFI